MNMTNPPIAKKVPHKIEIHSQILIDDYAWLRADGWPDKVEDEAVLSHLKLENEYFAEQMKPLEHLKDQLFEELKGRVKLDDQSIYIKKDNFYYYKRNESDKDYPIYCRKSGSTDSAEEILLDVNEISKGKKFTSLGGFSVSPDHKLLAFSTDHTGGEKYVIKVLDIGTKQYLSDKVENTIGDIVWREDVTGFFYSPISENWRHDTVKFHKLGMDYSEDKIILHEPDPLYSVSIGKSASREYILIHVGGHDNNEIHYIKMDDDNFKTNLISPRKDGVQYNIDHNGKYFYMHSNSRGLEKDSKVQNFHILRSSDLSSWEIFIPENKQQYLSGFDLTKNYLLLNYKKLGLPRLVAYDLTSDLEKEIKFPDAAFSANVYSTNVDEDDIKVNYTSFIRPNHIYNYQFDQDSLTLIKQQEIPSGFDPNEYNVERIFATSKDGTKIPVSLFYKKALFKKDGTNPLYLYGYGSYGISIPPSFRNSAVSLVNRGFVFAISHIRGGSDIDYDWYEAAKFLNKKRTFDDFIASTEGLIDQKYTSKGNIVIAGGSAGGMLIGNVVNQRPEFYKLAIAHVPFVDVLNTMLDENLPLTPGEYKEWGDPKESEYFEYIKSYSPYENVKAQSYPNIFVTAGLSDPRVGYWEAAKWVAVLRDKKIDNNFILCKINMDFGHKGASGRFDYLKETAEELAFVMKIFLE